MIEARGGAYQTFGGSQAGRKNPSAGFVSFLLSFGNIGDRPRSREALCRRNFLHAALDRMAAVALRKVGALVAEP